MPTHTFKELTRQRAYMRMWFARIFGAMGSQMLMVAVGWQMYDLTGSAWDLGLVGLYQFMPALLLTLVAGHVADRVHRGRIIAGCLITQAAVAMILVAATQGWQIDGGHHAWVSRELLLAVSVLLGVARAFQMPAQQALTPVLVPPAMLPRAMAFSSAGMQAAIIGGPALGGVIFVAGATAVYATCAGLFATGCGLIAVLRYDHAPPPREPVTLRTLLAGVEFVWQRKALLGAVSLDLFAVLLGGATALLPIFAKDILHTGPWGLGLLRAAPAVGALLMSVWLARHNLQQRVGTIMFASVAGFGVATLVFAVSTTLWLSLAALFALGAFDMVSMVIRGALVQLDTPDDMRGRVSAVNAIFINTSNQLGEFESGMLAAWVGAVGATVIGGIGTLVVVGLWMGMFPTLRLRQRLHVEAAAPDRPAADTL